MIQRNNRKQLLPGLR